MTRSSREPPTCFCSLLKYLLELQAGGTQLKLSKMLLSPNPQKATEEINDKLSGDEALAYYIDSKSTTQTYKITRKICMQKGSKVFPSLYSLRKSQIACFPPEEHIVVTETRAEMKVQAVLDKTAEHLVLVQEVLNDLLPRSSFKLISKWGSNGSSGHITYKQKFTDANDADEYLFVFSFVPIRLCDELGNIKRCRIINFKLIIICK